MGKRTTTIASFAVKIKIPTGSNIIEMQRYIIASIGSYKGSLDPKDPIATITKDDFTVALVKKETTYA